MVTKLPLVILLTSSWIIWNYLNFAICLVVVKLFHNKQHCWTQKLASAKRPMVIVGSEMFKREDGHAVHAAVTSIAHQATLTSRTNREETEDGWRVLNVLHRVIINACVRNACCSATCVNNLTLSLSLFKKILKCSFSVNVHCQISASISVSFSTMLSWSSLLHVKRGV